MKREPILLKYEKEFLINKYFLLFSEQIENINNLPAEDKSLLYLKKYEWIYKYASDNLRLLLNYERWIADEGQLLDGSGNYIKDIYGKHEYIFEWAVDDEGYCIYKDTTKYILDYDGHPIKNPVYDRKLVDLLELENNRYKKWNRYKLRLLRYIGDAILKRDINKMICDKKQKFEELS